MLMTTRVAQQLVAPLLLACLCACNHVTPPPSPTTCNCSIFPPKSGCDSQCGIATGVVESVQGDSVTLQVPSITTDSTGKQTAIMTKRTFLVGAAEAKQLQSIAPGARVALTLQKEIGQNSVKSVRAIPRELAK